MNDLYFDQPTTVRDLITKYPKVLDMLIAVPAYNGVTEYLGVENGEGNMAIAFTVMESIDYEGNPQPTLLIKSSHDQ